MFVVGAINRGNHLVQAFEGDGSVVREWSEKGLSQGKLWRAMNVAIDAEYDLVYVLHFTNDVNDADRCVSAFRSDGVRVRQWSVGQCGLGIVSQCVVLSISSSLSNHGAKSILVGEGGSLFEQCSVSSHPFGQCVHPSKDLLFLADGVISSQVHVHRLLLDGTKVLAITPQKLDTDKETPFPGMVRWIQWTICCASLIGTITASTFPAADCCIPIHDRMADHPCDSTVFHFLFFSLEHCKIPVVCV